SPRSCIYIFFFLRTLRPPRSTLVPYTTLFRSRLVEDVVEVVLRVLVPDPLEGRAVDRELAHAAVGEVDARVTLLADLLRELEERSEEHTSELQSRSDLVCRLLLEKKKNTKYND